MSQSIESLDQQFADRHRRSCDLVAKLSPESLYATPATTKDSCGDQVLRGAAAVEQSFGGLTANLWDDPFEWTLPETLQTPATVVEYLNEVEATRLRAFSAFEGDGDLLKEIMTPNGRTELLPFLLDTLKRAGHHLQRAESVFELLK